MKVTEFSQNMSEIKKRGRKKVYKSKRKTKLTLTRIMKPEVKYCDSFQDWIVNLIGTQVTLACATPIPGSASNQRVGARIQVTGLRVRGSISTPNSHTNPGALRVRASLVRFTNVNNTSAPTYDNLFDKSVITDRTMTQIDLWSNKSARVLREFVTENDAIDGEIYNFDWYVKLNDIMTLIDGGSGVYSDSLNYGYAVYIAAGGNSITAQDGYNCCVGSYMTYIDC